MKKCFISIGKALAYFGLYLSVQTIVTFIYTTILTGYLFATGAVNIMDSANLEIALTESLTEHLMIIVLLANLITLLGLWLYFIIRKKKVFKELSIHKISPNLYLPLSILAFALNLFTVTAMALLPISETTMNGYNSSSNILFAGNIFVSIVSIVIVAPIFEEILFRGLIYNRLKTGMPIWIAAVISSLIFGVVHGHIIWVIYATLLALVFVYLFELTGSLFTCIFAHFIYNLSGLLINFIPVDITILSVALFIISAVIIFFAHKMLRQNLTPKALT